MKKIITFLVLLVISLFVTSCSDKISLPDGEYWLTIVDEYDMLYEPLNNSYKAGETIIVKTHLVYDAETNVYINGSDAKSNGTIKNENENHYIYNEWEFTMPSKNSVLVISSSGGMGVGVDVHLIDQDKLVINEISISQIAGSSCNLHTLTKDVKITINTAVLENSPVPVCDISGEIVYYEWCFKVPYVDTNVYVEPAFFD
ncbi:MAG: hypothetical protein IJW54_00295 [Clostridia bacterium]|nr:hypothetical protein [Clostridia bacterium]